MPSDILTLIQNETRFPEEIRQLYTTLEEFDKDIWFILDMRKTHSHWFSAYDFFFIRPFLESTPAMGEFYCKYSLEPHRDEDTNTLILANRRVQDMVKMHWEAPNNTSKVFVFAWANKSNDQDLSLFYAFDENWTNKGLYIDSLNRATPIFIANSLAELFELDRDSISNAVKNANGKIVHLPRKQASLSDFRNVLKKGQYQVMDAEFGSLMDFDFLKSIFDEYIIPCTAGGLYYTKLKDTSIDDTTTKIEWKVNRRSWVIEHDADTDYLDFKIFQQINIIIEALNITKKRFVVFMEPGFGQEFGLAFISDQVRKKLQQVKSIEIMVG